MAATTPPPLRPHPCETTNPPSPPPPPPHPRLPPERPARHRRPLAAVLEVPQGVRSLDARIEDLLPGWRRGASPASSAKHHFHGRRLLVTGDS